MEELDENHDIVKKALLSLFNSVNSSSLPDNEKIALKSLVEKLLLYYDNKLAIMLKKGINVNSNDERVNALKCFITDIIVEINSVLTGENDVYYFISVINKRLSNREIDRVIKIKKK